MALKSSNYLYPISNLSFFAYELILKLFIINLSFILHYWVKADRWVVTIMIWASLMSTVKKHALGVKKNPSIKCILDEFVYITIVLVKIILIRCQKIMSLRWSIISCLLPLTTRLCLYDKSASNYIFFFMVILNMYITKLFV